MDQTMSLEQPNERHPWGVTRKRVCGIPIDSLTLEELLPLMDLMVAARRQAYVSFVDGNLSACAIADPAIVRVLEAASLVLPDGAALVLGARLLGEPVAERLVGPNVMMGYLAHGLAKGRRHFFYGGAPGVAAAMQARMVRLLPGLEVVGTYSPPFRPLLPAEEEEVKLLIEQSGAEVLWVGLGAPKQDLWMAEHAGKIDVPLMLGVGAAFDYLSGAKKRAPLIVQRLGMEWLHRMFTQGGRLFWRNSRSLPIFAFALFREVIRVRLKQKP